LITRHLQGAPVAGLASERLTGRIALLIPVWQPDHDLVELVASLLALGFPAMIVLNDGSDPDRSPIFEELAHDRRVRVVKHAVNLGKGRALKIGLNDFLTHDSEFCGVVTCDSDGQHRPEDVRSIADALRDSSGKLVLGSRQFDGAIPVRSRLGNTLTRCVFALLTGKKLSDTQSGLRGFRKQIIPRLMRLEGERYEYEMNVLADAAVSCGVSEVPIETIYIDGNRSSHFDPVWDSMRIYFILVRFYLSSLISSSSVIAFLSKVFGVNVLMAKVLVETLLSLVSFSIQRTFIFRSQEEV
jgi:glycosyltransferase involved in cell wall biosynthesis